MGEEREPADFSVEGLRLRLEQERADAARRATAEAAARRLQDSQEEDRRLAAEELARRLLKPHIADLKKRVEPLSIEVGSNQDLPRSLLDRRKQLTFVPSSAHVGWMLVRPYAGWSDWASETAELARDGLALFWDGTFRVVRGDAYFKRPSNSPPILTGGHAPPPGARYLKAHPEPFSPATPVAVEVAPGDYRVHLVRGNPPNHASLIPTETLGGNVDVRRLIAIQE